ncbi:MAG: SagB/ThcOx family dehydrogenase [Erysipelotrichaceae bacterium]|nr:SagB/ThcOx family dehydrogenase [Erysipelotrichaceae bacterium]
MDEREYQLKVAKGRAFMRYEEETDWESDQQLKKPQPPLVKAQIKDETIVLPKSFEELNINKNLTELLIERKSHRVYTEETISLLELSYLLWATQGVKSIRGNNYATLRTVPSGGARHPFETYLIVQYCEGLKQGIYHYLPLKHELELISELEDDIKNVMNQCVCGQAWVKKCSVLFLYTCVPYRAEWRYGFEAHRPALIDLGHIGENLYLSSVALGFGTCGVAAFDDTYCNQLLKIDPEQEYIVYTQPVGRIKQEDQVQEDSFYAFLKEE